MFTKKPRVVIRAFMCRRDVASASLLAKCLEYMGCDVKIASVRNFTTILKLWVPDVAVYTVWQAGITVKKINPKIKNVFLDGEGFLPDEHSHAVILKKMPHLSKPVDMVLVWGKSVFNEIKDIFYNMQCNKVHIVGWPSLDFIRFKIKKNPKSSLNSIGFVGRFPNINDNGGTQPVRVIPALHHDGTNNSEKIITQTNSFVCMIDCIKKILSDTKYNVSIRPHPLEQIESYYLYKKDWFKNLHTRVHIDNSLSFTEWAQNQKIIVSPTSLSCIDAYLLKKPIVNIDYIAGIYKYNHDRCWMNKQWQSLAYMPKTLNDFIDKIKSNKLKVIKNTSIEKQLRDYGNWNINESSTYKAAKYISDFAKTNSAGFQFRLPSFVLELIDNYRFWKHCKINPYHHNLNYKKGFHKPVKDINNIFKKIIDERVS